MSTWSLLGASFLAAVTCFTACGGDGDDDGDGGAGGGTTGGNAGEGGAPSGGSSTGGSSTGGSSTGGRPTGGSGGAAGEAGAASGMGGEGGVPGGGGEGGASCEPTDPAAEVCDGIDNDCNGIVDDIDAGNDGIFDCLNILLIGAPGTFTSSTFQSWLEEQGTTVTRIHATGTPPELTSADFASIHVAILDGLLRDYTLTESRALGAWVRGGGGLMSLNGHTGGADRTRGNSLIADLGAEYVAGLYNLNVTTFLSHPLTTDLTSVTFSGGYRVGTLSGGEAGSTVVAEIPDGPVGIALVREGGRAFVWGDEWVEFDTLWNSQPEIKKFWVNAIGWLGQSL